MDYNVGGGFGGITYGSTMAFIVGGLCDFYADSRIVRDYYSAMRKFVEYLSTLELPGNAYVGPSMIDLPQRRRTAAWCGTRSMAETAHSWRVCRRFLD